MRLLWLDFPTLPISLVRRARPQLAERPIILIDGTGPGALVTAASPVVVSRGVHPGMRAAQARSLHSSAAFLPDNASDCVDEMERVSAIISKYATLSVAVVASTAVMVDISEVADETREAERLLSLARQWTRLDVRAGVGSSRNQAFAAASLSRKSVVVDPRPAPVMEPPVVPLGVISGHITLDADASENRSRLAGLTRRLDRLQDGYRSACREIRLRAGAEDMSMVRILKFDRPVRATEALDRITEAVKSIPITGSTVLEVHLERPAPLPVLRAHPFLAEAV